MGTKIKVHEQPMEVTHVLANEIGEILAIVRPFVCWPLLAVGAALLHHFWAMSAYAVAFIVVSAVLIPVLVWFLHDEHHIGQFTHTAITSVLVATVLGMVDILGWTKANVFSVLFVVPMLCLTWSIRGGISARNEAKGQHLNSYFEQAGLPDTHMKIHKKDKPKRKWRFSDAGGNEVAEVAALPEGKQRSNTQDQRVTGTVHHSPGDTTEDVLDKLRRVESAANFPPGTLMVTPNIDDAGMSDVVMSDPRLIGSPMLYPGPSYIGGSIADTISVGKYQDGTETEFDLFEIQLQIMGQTGSGKSLGAGWSTLAEVITRHDVVVWGIDVTKGMQTLGPLAPALHRLATDDDAAKQLLDDVQAMIKPRTNYLAEKGLSKWQKGCGLNYLIVWLEEVPDIIAGVGKAGKDSWVKAIKAARSAGITFVWSLQRSDFTQIPTIARGQGARWCFGVADQKEAAFGLSTAQIAAGCEPQKWGNRKPGMSYLDAPSIPDAKIATAMRTWYWGNDDSLIKAHALKYPASAKPYDPIMAETVDSSPVATATPAAPGKRPLKIPVVQPDKEKMPSDQARTKVRAWLLDHKDQKIIAADIMAIIDGTGYSRAWGYKVMRELTAEGFLIQGTSDGFSYEWTVNP